MAYVDGQIAWVPQVPGSRTCAPNADPVQILSPPGAGFIVRVDAAFVIQYWDYDENSPIHTEMAVIDEDFPEGIYLPFLIAHSGITNSPNVTPLTQPIEPQWNGATAETLFYLPGNLGLSAVCLQGSGAGVNSYGVGTVFWSKGSIDPSYPIP